MERWHRKHAPGARAEPRPGSNPARLGARAEARSAPRPDAGPGGHVRRAILLASELDVFESFATWAGRHEQLRTSDAIAVAAVVGLPRAASVYSWRALPGGGRGAQAAGRHQARPGRHHPALSLPVRLQPERGLLGGPARALRREQRRLGAAQRLLGRPSSSSLDIGALIVPSRALETGAAFEQALGREPQQVETALVHKDGHVVELSVTGLPIIVDDEVVGVYCIGEDITARKQLERELLGLTAGGRAGQQRQVAVPGQREPRDQDPAHHAARDGRAPDGHASGRPAGEVRRDHGPVRASVCSRWSTTSSTSPTSRPGVARPRRSRSTYEPSSSEVTATLRHRGRSARRWTSRSPSTTRSRASCSGDPARIGRVLTNLLDNAVKFTDEGWVRTSVTASGRVRRPGRRALPGGGHRASG